VITNDVSDYINSLVRIAHVIRNHPLLGGNEESTKYLRQDVRYPSQESNPEPRKDEA